MNGIKRNFQRFTFAIALGMIFLYSCSDNFESSIPDVSVNLSINIINHNELTVIGGGAYFNAGYGGIWVVNGSDNTYYAYDATCPYEVSTSSIIEFDGGVGTCPTCGTKYFMLEGGYVLSGTGPGTEPLLQYHTTYSGGRIYVTN